MERFTQIRQLIKEKIGNLLYPKRLKCTICSQEIISGDFCPNCIDSVRFNNGSSKCVLCSRPITGEGDYCLECNKYPIYFERARAPFLYKGGAGKLIRKLKYNDSAYIAEIFARYMAKEYQNFVKCDIIVPVPMWEGRLKQRYYNQTEKLVAVLAKYIDLPINLLLTRIRDTEFQEKLGPKERRENVKSAFRVNNRREVKGKRILLIDDMFTTGSTVNECSRILKYSGALEVYVITAAIAEFDKL